MDEARTRAALRETIEAMRSSGLFGSLAESHAALYKRDLAGSHALETAIREEWEKYHPPLLEQLLDEAPTSRSASDALHAIAAHHLEQGIDIPDRLKAWIAEHHVNVAERRPAAPALKKGRDPDQTLVRNASVQYLMMQLQHIGFPATKNEATEEGLTACQLIADETGLSTATVHRIWVGRESVPALKRAFRFALHWHFRDLVLYMEVIPIKFTRAN